jgi:hypothetical protein
MKRCTSSTHTIDSRLFCWVTNDIMLRYSDMPQIAKGIHI